MSDDEQAVMDDLVNAWNKFIKLPIKHPDEINEFRSHFHDIQRIIICRQYGRVN